MEGQDVGWMLQAESSLMEREGTKQPVIRGLGMIKAEHQIGYFLCVVVCACVYLFMSVHG